MVIDSSALVAILLNEAEALRLIAAISEAEHRLVSSLSFFETSIVIGSRYQSAGLQQLDELIGNNDVILIPLTEEQSRIARQAYFIYGKGYHPAKLNLGDCCSYALAKVMKQPLLFKGNDFSQTDIETVVY
ncbi:MAG: type II toxin-antitoxin system VapC family toxin [Cyanobacteria bacterium J06636_16]